VRDGGERENRPRRIGPRGMWFQGESVRLAWSSVPVDKPTRMDFINVSRRSRFFILDGVDSEEVPAYVHWVEAAGESMHWKG
jgi:hypothetical protein